METGLKDAIAQVLARLYEFELPAEASDYVGELLEVIDRIDSELKPTFSFVEIEEIQSTPPPNPPQRPHRPASQGGCQEAASEKKREAKPAEGEGCHRASSRTEEGGRQEATPAAEQQKEEGRRSATPRSEGRGAGRQDATARAEAAGPLGPQESWQALEAKLEAASQSFADARARLEGVREEMRRFAGVDPEQQQIVESSRSWEHLE